MENNDIYEVARAIDRNTNALDAINERLQDISDHLDSMADVLGIFLEFAKQKREEEELVFKTIVIKATDGL